MISLNKDQHKPFNSRKKAFLRAYARCGLLGYSAKLVGISVVRVCAWKKTDEVFFRQFQEAQLRFLERLESEADRRAMEGVETPIFDKHGRIIGKKLKYSDSLLMFRLKALAPQKYREKYEVDITNEQLDAAIERQLALKRQLEGMAGSSQAQITGPPQDGDRGGGGGGPEGPIVGEVLPP